MITESTLLKQTYIPTLKDEISSGKSERFIEILKVLGNSKIGHPNINKSKLFCYKIVSPMINLLKANRELQHLVKNVYDVFQNHEIFAQNTLKKNLTLSCRDGAVLFNHKIFEFYINISITNTTNLATKEIEIKTTEDTKVKNYSIDFKQFNKATIEDFVKYINSGKTICSENNISLLNLGFYLNDHHLIDLSFNSLTEYLEKYSKNRERIVNQAIEIIKTYKNNYDDPSNDHKICKLLCIYLSHELKVSNYFDIASNTIYLDCEKLYLINGDTTISKNLKEYVAGIFLDKEFFKITETFQLVLLLIDIEYPRFLDKIVICTNQMTETCLKDYLSCCKNKINTINFIINAPQNHLDFYSLTYTGNIGHCVLKNDQITRIMRNYQIRYNFTVDSKIIVELLNKDQLELLNLPVKIYFEDNKNLVDENSSKFEPFDIKHLDDISFNNKDRKVVELLSRNKTEINS